MKGLETEGKKVFFMWISPEKRHTILGFQQKEPLTLRRRVSPSSAPCPELGPRWFQINTFRECYSWFLGLIFHFWTLLTSKWGRPLPPWRGTAEDTPWPPTQGPQPTQDWRPPTPGPAQGTQQGQRSQGPLSTAYRQHTASQEACSL